jgi:RNA polymerase sigma factor (sigma-70 family)
MDLRRLAEKYRSNPGPEALIELLRGCQGLVHTLCYRVLRHAQDAEDAAQQVLLELIDELPRLRDAEHVERWLHRVSFHVALNLKRSRRRPMEMQRRDDQAQSEHVDRLHEEIARLDPDLRAVVVEHYFERRTLEQIAEQRGCSTVAVWKKVEKAREQLRLGLSGVLGAGAMAWLGTTLEAQVSMPAAPDLLSPTILARAGRAAGAAPRVVALRLGAIAAGIVGIVALIRAVSPASPPERPPAVAARPVALAEKPIPVAPPPAPQAVPKQDPSLPDGVLARLGGAGIRHSFPVTCVAFSPDGSKLASCGGQEVSLWDLAAGRELRRVKGDERKVDWVTFSPDGKTMAYAGNDHRIRIAPLEGEPRLLRGHVHHIFNVAFSGDGKTLASASADETVRIWDVESGKELKALKGHTDGIQALALSPDGWRVATRSQDRTVRVWNASTGEPLVQVPIADTWTHPLPIVFSPDGRAVVFHDQGRIHFIDPQDGRAVAPPLEDEDPPSIDPIPGLFPGKRNTPICSLVFSPNGEFLVTGRSSGFLRIWHVPTRTVKRSFTLSPIHSLALSPDGALLALGGDRGVTFWDASTGKRRDLAQGHQSSVMALAVAPAGKSLASVDADGQLLVWDLATGASLSRTPVPILGGVAQSPLLAFSSEGSRLTYAGHLKLETRTLADGAKVEEVPLTDLIPAPMDPRQRMFFQSLFDGKSSQVELPRGLATRLPGGLTPDGLRIVLAVRDGQSIRLAVFDLPSRKEIATKEIAGEIHVRCVAFSPDQQSLAVAWGETLWDKDGNSSHRYPPAEVVDLSSGRTRASLKGHDQWVASIAFSPDGSKLATASGDHTVRIWNSGSGQLLATLKGHKGGVAHVAWSPDGAAIASAGYDHSVRFWHADTGLLLRSTAGANVVVDSLTFDKENRLITGMSDGSILIWSVPHP